MDTIDNLFENLDSKLKDPNSHTDSLSFKENSLKSFSDLFKNSNDFMTKTWEPANSSPSSIPKRPQGE